MKQPDIIILKTITLLFIFVCAISVKAQNENAIWTAKPVFSELLEGNENENVVGIFLNEKYEYMYGDDGELQMIHTLHKKFRLNNDEAINQFNKISLSLNDVIEVIDIKARTIKPNGESVEFDKNNIKEVKDEDSGKSYKIFAIDGIEKGDDVEYYVERRMYGNNFGRAVFQFEFPLQHASFEIVSPKNLIYDVKGYNGFPNAEHTVLEDERNRFKCIKNNIEPIKEEKFSYVLPRKERIEYRLAFNKVYGYAPRLTWDDAAIRVYESMYLDVDDKVMNKWMDFVQVKGTTELDIIKNVEDFVKANIYVEKYNIPEFSDLNFVLENKITGDRGIIKVYANLFKKIGIDHELVLTSDRSVIKFDGEFQSWNYLDEYLIYFPDLDTYLDPSNMAYRLGTVNGELTATDGLFIVPVKIGDFESAIGKIKYIKATSDKDNYDNMIIDITVDIDENTTRVKTERGMKGLSGGYLNKFYEMMDTEQKQNMLKQITQTKAPDPVFKTLEVKETSTTAALKDAEFIIYSDLKTDAFLENAGNKLLVSIGESIGPQTEMYFEENRKSKGENDWNRKYYREIVFHVPEGYKIANPEVGRLNIVEGDVFGFESDYTYEGDQYKIVVNEYYRNIFVKDEEFEGFENVINAAADFNKVVLVLQEL